MRIFGKPDTTIAVSTETIIKTIVIAAISLVALRLLGNITHQLTLIGVAAFLALALNPIVSKLTHRLPGKSRASATAAAYLIVLTILGGFLFLVVPPLVRQTTDFIQDVPQTLNDFKTQDSALARAARRYNLDEQIQKVSDDFSSHTQDLSPVFSTASRILGTLLSIITVLVLTFMMLVEGPLWFDRFLSMQPAHKRERIRKISTRMYRVVTGYVNGQVLIAAIAATFAMVALLIGGTIFDTSINPVAMAGIIFVFGLIPMFGNILGASIVVLVCLFSSGSLALAMAIFFLIYQQVENATLQPYIQARNNQLTPLTVFVAALVGVGLGGILGALAAIPIAGCIRILLEEHWHKKFPTQEAVEGSQK